VRAPGDPGSRERHSGPLNGGNFNAKGVYRRMIADNGKDMTPEELGEFFNCFGGGGKAIGDEHENFGIGAKTALLPWNHHGVVVISWVDGQPAMIRIMRDETTGEYGLKIFQVEDDEGDESRQAVVEPYDDLEHGVDWSKVKPSWIDQHGTVIVLLGNHADDDTFRGDLSRDEDGTKGAKWLEVLKEIAPDVARVALLFNPETAPGHGSFFLSSIDAAAPSLAVKPITAPVQDAAGIERAIAAFARESNGGLFVMPDLTTQFHRDLIIGLAARHRLPAVYSQRTFVLSGGLISYGVDTIHQFRLAATYVNRILRGEKPSDLPVQAPVKFELAINQKTAKALGLDVPLTLLARADEVIE
jgi:ABC transporter substrate binding protein